MTAPAGLPVPLEASPGASGRPRYGGTLRVEVAAATASPLPTTWRGNAAEARLASLVYDGLVRFDEAGRIEPALALSWQHDAGRRQWQFRLRRGVRFHDGAPLTPTAAVLALEGFAQTKTPVPRVSVFGETLILESPQPLPDLLAELAGPLGAIFRRGGEGQAAGTGPFRIAEWEPGRRALLAANEEYWEGRPFLDAVELRMNRPLREQWVNYELGRADVIELAPEDAARAAQEGRRTWSSLAVELLAVVFTAGRAAGEEVRLREALAASVDRAALANVLLQRQGEAGAALLPQWLSGYAFLFPAERDLERAKSLAGELAAARRRMTLAYDSADTLAQQVAERMAVNAREGGLTVVVSGAADRAALEAADARIVRLRLAAPDAPATFRALVSAAELAEAAPRPASDDAEEFFVAERALAQTYRIIPLVHLPQSAALSARVRGWQPAAWGAWRLERAWVKEGDSRE